MFIVNIISKVPLQRFGYSAVGARGSIVPALPASLSREGLIWIARVSPSVKQFNQFIICKLLEIKEQARKFNLNRENTDKIINLLKIKRKLNVKFKIICGMEDTRNLNPPND